MPPTRNGAGGLAGSLGALAALALALLLGASACAPAFSSRYMQQVDKSITYGMLAADTEAYQGKMVLLGGTIVSTTPRGQDTEIEVVQKELTSSGEPVISDKSAGRFLVLSQRFLDPAIYKTDRRLSVVGEVQGVEIRRLGESDYRYPVIAAREIRLWPIRMPYPVNFYWGIGSGYPYAYPYGGWGPYPHPFFWP